jgi:glycosyltransferase involved in cell wall biosynthesis
MKIGYVIQEGAPDVRSRPLSGAANHVLKVYQELRALGHDLRFLARYDGRIWRSDDLEKFEPVQVRRFDQGWRRQVERGVRGVQFRLKLPYVNWFESQRFAEAICQELGDRDLLYERLFWMSYGPGLAARRLGIPLVFEVNNGDFMTELERLGVAPKGLQRWLAMRIMRWAVQQGDFVVATGDGHRKRFIEKWGADPERMATVENGSEIVELLKREELRCFRQAAEPDAPARLAFVGAFEPWHGVLILLSAFAQVVAHDPRVHLLLIGSGTQRPQIEARIQQLGLQEHVELTGQLSIQQVAQRLAQADIGVAPYCGWMEFSGLKLFDYKSAGLATVASGQDGQPATLEHGVTGWIVPPCDEDALAQALIRLVEDRQLARRIGRAARLDAEQRHGWRRTAEQLDRIFCDLVQGWDFRAGERLG